jgi:hypothetical protein
MWTLTDERNLCPPEFQARITEAGGINKFGNPNFLVVWGNTYTFRAGGIWEGDDENQFPTYTGYRDILLGMGNNAWLLLIWDAPTMTPEQFYIENFDEATGLSILGEFPYLGSYSIVSTLEWRHVVNGRLIIEPQPLTSMLIDLVIPTIIQAKEVSVARRKMVFIAKKEREDLELQNAIRESLEKGRLAFGTSTVSYEGKGGTMEFQKKVDALNRGWNDAMGFAAHLNKGIFQS